MSNQNRSTPSILPLLAAVATALLVIGAIAILVLNRLAINRGRNIEDVPQPPLLLPLVCAGLLLLATCWLVWLVRKNGIRHILTIIVAVSMALLLIATPLFTWQAFTSERDLTIISMTCDADSLLHTGQPILTNCQDDAVETIVLMEGVQSNDQWAPDVATGNLMREFRDLPGGEWTSALTVDGPPETVAVVAVGDRNGEPLWLGTFRPYMDPASARLRWSAPISLREDISTVRVLFYLSAQPTVPSASIRFEMRQCNGQNPRTFDATGCDPLEASAPFVIEKSPTGPRTWRHPLVTRDGSAMMITNLEARTYELQPDYTSIQMYTQSTDVLIIPSPMEQVAGNSIVEPGEDTFEVTIDSNTGEMIYTVYVFPTGPTFAGRPKPDS